MEGRLKFQVLLKEDDIGYESGADKWSPGFAFRWSHYIDIIDIGITQFYGNGCELWKVQEDLETLGRWNWKREFLVILTMRN